MPAVLIGIACTAEGVQEYVQLLENEQPQKKNSACVERAHQPGNVHCSAKNVEKVLSGYDDYPLIRKYSERGRNDRYKDHARKPGRSIRNSV